MIKIFIQTLLFIFLITLPVSAQPIKLVDLSSLFRKFEGGFSLYDLKTGETVQYRPGHCAQRYSPCSTFKIPNSLIGFETGILSDTSFVIPYDSIRHPRNNEMMETDPFRYWFHDLSLNLAFRYSCVWYYQELARKIGDEKMLKRVQDLHYGNMNITSGLDNFWLCGSLQISINEQIEFLKNFYTGNLQGFSSKSIDAVKSIMLYEATPEFKLYGKTGSGDCETGHIVGWYVGFIETKTGPKVFAMNLIVSDFSSFQNNFRIELTKKILRYLKVVGQG